MPEAQLEDSGSGLAPASDGWFVVSVRDSIWLTFDTRGSVCAFESLEAWARGSESGKFWFRQLGINLTVLAPGQPPRVLGPPPVVSRTSRAGSFREPCSGRAQTRG